MDNSSEVRSLTDVEMDAVTGGASSETWWSGTDEAAEFAQLALSVARCCVLGSTSTF